MATGNITNPDNFRGRVNFAANYIAANREATRRFDACFEMFDGDAVSLALIRRVRARPHGRLAQNIWRYLSRETVEATEIKYADCDADALSAQQRAAASKEYNLGW